jgi:pantoate--beta-alanine ligase
MQTVATVAELRACVDLWRAEAEQIALVPTMGALHAGHMRLVDEARKLAPRTVVSLFVNPRQFASGEDLATYPRNLEADSAKLAEAGVDLLYAPCLDQVYPHGFATSVSVGGPAQGLEGSSRPGFFDGVATVVTKLFTQTRPDVALFGEKDYQQLQVVKRLVRDLDLRPSIVGVPTVRDVDGLACSSRNAYLDGEQRLVAPRRYALLSRTAERMADHDDPQHVLNEAEADLKSSFDKVDYLAWRDGETFEAGMTPGRAGRLLAAVMLGRTRLIDNVPVAPLNMRTKS